jgi:beta-phosphoglucomutase-like phosphatase (HAD superfamily)
MTFGAIFDMDGVLVDSNAAHFAAFRRIGADLGMTFSDAELQQTFISKGRGQL